METKQDQETEQALSILLDEVDFTDAEPIESELDMATEKSAERLVKAKLQSDGWKVWKNHGTGMSEAGLPDLMGIRHGILIAIEMKAKGKDPTRLQMNQLKELADHGAQCFVVEAGSVAEFLNATRSTTCDWRGVVTRFPSKSPIDDSCDVIYTSRSFGAIDRDTAANITAAINTVASTGKSVIKKSVIKKGAPCPTTPSKKR